MVEGGGMDDEPVRRAITSSARRRISSAVGGSEGAGAGSTDSGFADTRLGSTDFASVCGGGSVTVFGSGSGSDFGINSDVSPSAGASCTDTGVGGRGGREGTKDGREEVRLLSRDERSERENGENEEDVGRGGGGVKF